MSACERKCSVSSRASQSAGRRLIRALVSSEQNHRCYCGIRTNEATTSVGGATLEHVMPRAEGGADTYGNLVMACLGCNEGRGSRPLGPALSWRQKPGPLEHYRLGR
ncbi:HNH endonuclease [Roseomonas sp. BN140053]|uniref:HNH endonuclease n=1 Tax=Roseomonas sp. BN140053 TaxID=3391898 RepID=UPI0039E7ABE5